MVLERMNERGDHACMTTALSASSVCRNDIEANSAAWRSCQDVPPNYMISRWYVAEVECDAWSVGRTVPGPDPIAGSSEANDWMNTRITTQQWQDGRLRLRDGWIDVCGGDRDCGATGHHPNPWQWAYAYVLAGPTCPFIYIRESM